METSANVAGKATQKNANDSSSAIANDARPHVDIDLISATDKDLLNAIQPFCKAGYIAGIVSEVTEGNRNFNNTETKSLNLKVLFTFEGAKDLMGRGRLVTQSYWIKSNDVENPMVEGDVVLIEAKRAIIVHTEKFMHNLDKLVNIKSIVELQTVLAPNGQLFDGYSAMAAIEDSSKLRVTEIQGSKLFNVRRVVKASIEA